MILLAQQKLKNQHLNKRDSLIIIAIFLIIILLMFIWPVIFSENGKVAHISCEKNSQKIIDLNTDQKFVYNGLTVMVIDGAIGVVNSPCQDKICVNSGFINKVGQSIICLPNKVTIKISSDTGLDYVVK